MTVDHTALNVLLRAAEIQMERGHTRRQYESLRGRVCIQEAVSQALKEVPSTTVRKSIQLSLAVGDRLSRAIIAQHGSPVMVTDWNDEVCRSRVMAARMLRAAVESEGVAR